MKSKKLFAILTLFVLIGVLSTATVSASVVKGKWGCYEYPSIKGIIKGRVSNDVIFAKFTFHQRIAYMYAMLDNGIFSGTVLYKGDFYPIEGSYYKHNGNIVAGFTILGFHGWILAKIV